MIVKRSSTASKHSTSLTIGNGVVTNTIQMIKKYSIINECYDKASYFVNIASNALNIFNDTKEKNTLKKLTYFSLERNY